MKTKTKMDDKDRREKRNNKMNGQVKIQTHIKEREKKTINKNNE